MVVGGVCHYYPMNKGGKGAQRLFAGNIGLIYPDFISRNNEVRIIADAEYKPLDNIGNKDCLQVLAYMFRFDREYSMFCEQAKESGAVSSIHQYFQERAATGFFERIWSKGLKKYDKLEKIGLK